MAEITRLSGCSEWIDFHMARIGVPYVDIVDALKSANDPDMFWEGYFHANPDADISPDNEWLSYYQDAIAVVETVKSFDDGTRSEKEVIEAIDAL